MAGKQSIENEDTWHILFIPYEIDNSSHLVHEIPESLKQRITMFISDEKLEFFRHGQDFLWKNKRSGRVHLEINNKV